MSASRHPKHPRSLDGDDPFLGKALKSCRSNTYNPARRGYSSSSRGSGSILGSSRRGVISQPPFKSRSSARFWHTVMGGGGRGSSSYTPSNALQPNFSTALSESGKLRPSQSFQGAGSSSTPVPDLVHQFKCGVCLTTFSQKYNLTRHMRAVHDGRRPFQCEICMREFAEKYTLTVHLDVVHSEMNPFACKICASSFTSRSHLSRHFRALHSPTPRTDKNRIRRNGEKKEGA